MTTILTTPSSHFQSTTPTNTSSIMIHRNQHQIRAQFLNTLGIVARPPRRVATLKYDDDNKNKESNRKISFSHHVSIHSIPSHREYSQRTRQDLWNGVQAVAEIVERNKIEFLAEHWDWEQVLEEDSFVRLENGELMHPATFQRMQDEKQLTEQARKRKKKQKQYAYKSISACLDFSPPPARSPSPRSRTRKRSSSSRMAVQ